MSELIQMRREYESSLASTGGVSPEVQFRYGCALVASETPMKGIEILNGIVC